LPGRKAFRRYRRNTPDEDESMSALPVTTSIRMFLVLCLALGTLAAGTLLMAPPAEAKRLTCLQKYNACQQRCTRRYDLASSGWYSCHNRTCAPQHDNCAGLR
jgi:hypothetical protein